MSRTEDLEQDLQDAQIGELSIMNGENDGEEA